MDALPCTVCHAPMLCYNTAAISGENQTRTHYLLSCGSCGFGPAMAFPTSSEAVKQWNKYAKNINAKPALLMAEQALG